MRVKLFHIVLVACIGICFSNVTEAQAVKREKPETGYGACIIYNFHATGLGGDVRMKKPVIGHLFVVPEFSYFPPSNDYHELYAGVALHYEAIRMGSFKWYGLVAGFYNDWINAETYAPGQGKQHNFAYEAGIGLVHSWGCIRPFLEDGYDFKWKENSLRFGIYIYPGGCGAKEKCPAYGD